MAIRVLLVDDHRILREALRLTLAREPDLDVVGEASDAREAVEGARELRPDVVVLDIGLPDVSGLEAAVRLRRLSAPPHIVALSAHTDKRFVSEMLRSGAQGYVTKSAPAQELLRAVRAVAGGGSYLCPEVAGALVSEVRALGGEAARLGRREIEVLRLLAGGARSADIAQQLHISAATVEVHRRNIMRKLDLHSVAELTRYAVREGIVSA